MDNIGIISQNPDGEVRSEMNMPLVYGTVARVINGEVHSETHPRQALGLNDSLRHNDIDIWQQAFNRANFQWDSLIEWIGSKYNSQVGLTIQIFDQHNNVEFLYANFQEQYIDLYIKYNYINPWRDILYSKPTGYLIVGEKDSNFTEFMDKYALFQNHVMIPHNVNYGIGAILLKDNELNPKYTVSLIALRSEREGRYSEEEQKEFEKMIPRMVDVIAWHPEIVNFVSKYQEARYENIIDVKYRGKVLLFRIMFLNEYKSRLIESGFSEEDAAKATEILRQLYIDRKLPLPLLPSQQDEGLAPQAPPPVPETWEEAKAQVPGLKLWVEAKVAAEKEGRNFTIIDYLRDTQHGYGTWTLAEQGLPRNLLYRFEREAYNELHRWELRKDRTTKAPNKLPADMNMPTRTEVVDRKVKDLTHEQTQAARRMVSAKDRRR